MIFLLLLRISKWIVKFKSICILQYFKEYYWIIFFSLLNKNVLALLDYWRWDKNVLAIHKKNCWDGMNLEDFGSHVFFFHLIFSYYYSIFSSFPIILIGLLKVSFQRFLLRLFIGNFYIFYEIYGRIDNFVLF